MKNNTVKSGLNSKRKKTEIDNIFNIPSFLPLPLESKPTKKKFKFKDDSLQEIDLPTNNMSSPNITSQFIETDEDVDGVNGAKRVISPNEGSYFRKSFHGQAEDDKKKINNELFGYLLYDNFYKTFYNKDILNIRVEDMSQSPKLISKDIENFQTLSFKADDSDHDSSHDIVFNKFASDVVINDINDEDFNKKIVDIMLLSEIMMFSDLNNSGNIGLKQDQDNIYPVIIDFLTYEETALLIQPSNNLKYFLKPDPEIIKKIINCDDSIEEYTQIPFFYSLLVHNLAKENIGPELIANKIKTLSTDALKNNFFKDDSKFYAIIKNSFAELWDVSGNIRDSNKRNFDINNTQNNIINAITMFFELNENQLKNNNIDFAGCVKKIEEMFEVVKLESPKHTNKVIECRPKVLNISSFL